MACGARSLALVLPLLVPGVLLAQGLLGMDPGLPVVAGAAATRFLDPALGGVGVIDTSPSIIGSFQGFEPAPAPETLALPDGHVFSRLLAALELRRGRASGVSLDPQGRMVLAQGPEGYARRGIFVSRARAERQSFDAMQLGIDATAPEGTGWTVWFRGVDPALQAAAPWQQVKREEEVRYSQTWPAWQVQVVMFTTRADQTPTFTAVIGHPAVVGPVASLLGQGQGPAPGPSRSPSPPKPAPRPAPKPAPDPDAGGAPRVVTRAQWGAKPSTDGRTPQKVELFTIHHTASRVRDYHGAESIRGIQSFHQGTHGWSDIGYHYVIGPDGLIYEGRPPETVGAHCIPNTGKVGICLIGNFEAGDEVPAKAVDSLVWLLARLHRQFGIDPDTKLSGHRDFMQTACPGDGLYKMLPGIQARVKAKL